MKLTDLFLCHNNLTNFPYKTRACNDGKRTLCLSTETCSAKTLKIFQVNLFSAVLATWNTWNHCAPPPKIRSGLISGHALPLPQEKDYKSPDRDEIDRKDVIKVGKSKLAGKKNKCLFLRPSLKFLKPGK